MQRFIRKLASGALLGTLLVGGTFACSSNSSKPITNAEDLGELNMPLTAYGPSGTQYRLRNAEFQITNYYWYNGGMDGQGTSVGVGGAGGGPQSPTTIVVSSEDDPDATSINVDLESGQYSVYLLPGWSMEKVTADGATPVEATLISPDYNWLYVAPRSSTWAEYHFGIGDRELWLNGDLNINIHVWEDPNQGPWGGGGYGGYYPDDGGYGGYGGSYPDDGGYGGYGGSYPDDGGYGGYGGGY